MWRGSKIKSLNNVDVVIDMFIVGNTNRYNCIGRKKIIVHITIGDSIKLIGSSDCFMFERLLKVRSSTMTIRGRSMTIRGRSSSTESWRSTIGTILSTLRRKYNVVSKWQVPNSPDTNMLDLGAWATIQLQVEERHQKQVIHNDVLAKSVEYAFHHMLDLEKLLNVYNCWRKVLHLILKSRGGNELVEGCRGTANVDDVEELNLGSDDKQDASVDGNAVLDTDTDVEDYSDTDTESDDDDYGNLDMVSFSTDDDSTGYNTNEEVSTVLTALTNNMDDDSTVTELSTKNYLDIELLEGRDENDGQVHHGDDFDNDTHVIIEESNDMSIKIV